ncbi:MULTISPECIES: serine/threonine-protein kinase [unclassified Streptomyces]|uniref:serine/threonine-protein kinase n=1 Tax=unclassified Streptomyces TaxID=2593676 RepID=UPI0033B0000A
MTDQPTGSPYTPVYGGTALPQAGVGPLRPADPGRIGPYLSLGLLGSGGMGRVYLARHADGTPGLAAVKVIRPEYAENADFRRRFEREATVHARVGAPYTPELLGTGFEPATDTLWMATVYLPGLNLAEAVRECGVLRPDGAWRLVGDLGRALGALAATGIVHRDLKPSNVLLTRQGAHVVDFGIAQAVDASAITTTGNRVGTPAFMSPEYLKDGRCDTASDVFCCASTVVHAVTGHAPFGDGTGVDVLHRIASEEPNAEVMAGLRAADPALSDLLTACLSKDPSHRPTPEDLVEASLSQPRSTVWQEPLATRLLTRQRACETLWESPLPRPEARQAVGQGPGLGGAAGQPAVGSGLGPAAGQPAAVPGFGPASDTPAGGTPARRRGKPYAALVAVLTVCAVAVAAYVVTRPAPAADGTGSAAATASASGPGDDHTSLPGFTVPSTSSPTGKPKPPERPDTTTPSPDEKPRGEARPTPPPAPRTTQPRPSPSTPPSQRPTTPAEPPWLTDCTYYSGTELTRRGDRGQRVVQVQCMLTERGYGVGGSGVDGSFGKDTAAAVRAFQRDKGLEVDGQVGPKTWAALRSSQ